MILQCRLEFAYTQSPPSLKAFVGSLWQLSVAGGNLIVIIVASSNLLPQFYEYLLFAALMFVSMSIFGLVRIGVAFCFERFNFI